MKLIAMVCLICILHIGIAQPKEKDALVDSTFLTGNIQHPADLIQGLVPGLLVAKQNTAEFDPYDLRLRGTNTFSGRTNPLILVNGLVVPSWDFIDPNEIGKIRILSGSETSRFGMQGGSGVIEITTKQASENFQISYHGFAAVDTKIYKQKVLDAPSYRSLGGSDLGSTTVWLEETTRPAFSHVNNLSFGQRISSFNYRVGLNYRNVQGIQKETDYDRVNGLVNLKWTGSELLQVEYTGAVNNQTSNPGFTEVSRFAIAANPTMPIFFESGDYYQPQAFDYFNPSAIIGLSDKKTTQTNHLNLVRLTSNIGLAQLQLYASNSHQEQSLDETYDDRLRFRGGTLYQNDYSINHQQLGGRFEYDLQSGDWSISPALQLDNHIYKFENKTVQTFITGSQSQINTATEKGQVVLLGGAVSADFNFKDQWHVSIGDRLESSSALGDEAGFTHFPWLNSRLDISNFLGFGGTNYFTIGHGKTGMTPYQQGWSAERIGDFGQEQFANPNLRSEVVKNTDIGLDWRSADGRLGVGALWYWKIASDMIWEQIYDNGEEFALVHANAAKLANRGLELTIDYSQEIGDVKWQSQLVTTTFSSEWKSLSGDLNTNLDSTRYGLVFNAGFASPSVISFYENQPFGTITAIQTNGIDTQGQSWIMVDQNGDGSIYFEDLQVVGQALPKVTLGWYNSFHYQKLTASFLVSGAFGHSLVNETAVMYQPNLSWSYSNFLESYDEIAPISDRMVVDHFVQKASFVRISYFQLAYNLSTKPDGLLSQAQIYFAGNNLLTFTKYSGDNPDYKLSKRDYGLDASRTAGVDPKLPGFDSANQLYSYRSFVLGLKLSLF